MGPEDVAAMRDHPDFRRVVDGYCAASLGRYRALAPIERWMLSDTGRSSLSGVATVLAGYGGLTARALINSSPVTRGTVSRGRARLYLERALANGLFVAADSGAGSGSDARLVLSSRFQGVMSGVLSVTLEALSKLDPGLRPALARLPDPAFTARLSVEIGLLAKFHHELFPEDGPVELFQVRDGGTRLMEALILRQPAQRARLLETCHLSRTAVAGLSFCSRVHVNRLLADGETRGLLSVDGRTLTFAPEFSDAADHYFAAIFAITRTAATAIRALD